MNLTFLEASGGQRLSKHHTQSNGFAAYPHVKNFTSHHYELNLRTEPLVELERLLRGHGGLGHCLLKGDLKRPLENESRAGVADRVAYSNLLVLDIDGVELPRFRNVDQLTEQDVTYIAAEVLTEFPEPFQKVSYIAQASSSLGFKGEKVSLHIFILLEVAMPAKAIKLWLQSVNYASELFSKQIGLSANGHSLLYPLDVALADNSRLIFIAPPSFEDGNADPFSNEAQRIVHIPRETEMLDLAPLLSDISPELLRQQAQDIKNTLRRKRGFKAKQEKLSIVTVGTRAEEVLDNPDRMSIAVVNSHNPPFVQCNVNGGDSNGYYFSLSDPTYMYNFKGEPIWSIEKADPDFYAGLFEQFEEEFATEGKATFPIVARDFYTDTFYNGIYDPNLNQFTESYPLIPTSPSSIEGFMKSHGRAKPDFIPDARIVFDPCTDDDAVNLTNTPYYVNMFRKTKYMLNPAAPAAPLKLGDSRTIERSCPLVYTLTKHMLGGGDAEVEYFINWLSYVFQTRRKTMTAWVLQGVEGTGKGLFYTKILRPLFGDEHVPMRALQNIEEQFNLYMRNALFLVVDEFHMASASTGTVKIADKLKNQITENTMTIRAMRSNQHEMPNYTNFIFLTNRFDSVKLDGGDRRYNVAPRQERKLVDAHPGLVANIDKIKLELPLFAGILSTFEVDARLVRTPIVNVAKETMANVTMSVIEEFFNAVSKGNVSYFLSVLDISTTNLMQSEGISSAQRHVKTWLTETNWDYSVVPVEHLRVVYIVLSEERIAPRDFAKRAQRNGLTMERKRPANADSASGTALRGVVTAWRIDAEHKAEIIDRYFNDGDLKMLKQQGS